MKALLKKQVNGVEYAWSKSENRMLEYAYEAFIYASYSVVVFTNSETNERIRICLNKRPSRYIGNIVCDAWNKHILSIL